MPDIYMRLAKHLENLIMGYPYNEALIDLLKEMFNPLEAEVALSGLVHRMRCLCRVLSG